jgi:transposase
MNDGFAWWLVICGIGIGVGLAWLVMGRLPRRDDDVARDERRAEAAWISRSIAEYGGVAPEPLVEEILQLHQHYLQGPPLDPLADDDEDELPEDDERYDEVDARHAPELRSRSEALGR